MRLRMLGLAVSLAPLVWTAPVMAQDADKTYTITPKFTAGEMVKFSFNMNMTMKMNPEKKGLPIPPEMLMKMGGTIVQKTKTVKPDGGAIYTTELRGGTMEVMGHQQPLPASPATTIEVDGKGQIIKFDAPKTQGGGGFPGMDNFMKFDRFSGLGAILPENPVKVGDTWEKSLSGILGDSSITIKSKLLGIEMVNNKETLKVEQTVEMPMDMSMDADQKPTTDKSKAMMNITGKISVVGIVNIMAEGARILKSGQKMLANMTMTMQGKAAAKSPFGASLGMDMDGDVVMNLASVGKISDDVVKPKPAVKPTSATKKKSGSGKKSH